jgi:hypothetical protein
MKAYSEDLRREYSPEANLGPVVPNGPRKGKLRALVSGRLGNRESFSLALMLRSDKRKGLGCEPRSF